MTKISKFTKDTEMHEARGFRGVDGARYREDDEGHHIDRRREKEENTGNWYVRVNGKNLKDAKTVVMYCAVRRKSKVNFEG